MHDPCYTRPHKAILHIHELCILSTHKPYILYTHEPCILYVHTAHSPRSPDALSPHSPEHDTGPPWATKLRLIHLAFSDAAAHDNVSRIYALASDLLDDEAVNTVVVLRTKHALDQSPHKHRVRVRVRV